MRLPVVAGKDEADERWLTREWWVLAKMTADKQQLTREWWALVAADSESETPSDESVTVSDDRAGGMSLWQFRPSEREIVVCEAWERLLPEG